MSSTDTKPRTFLTEITPWLLGRQVSVYLSGRQAPLTGLTICHIGDHCIVARWNSSTHLIQRSQILFIRFAPDNDPCRDRTHSLHHCVSKHRATPIPDSQLTDHDPLEESQNATRLRSLTAATAAHLHHQDTTPQPPGGPHNG